MRLSRKKPQHCYHCYLHGYNDAVKHLYGITSFNPDEAPDNEAIRRVQEAHEKPLFIRQIEELLK